MERIDQLVPHYARYDAIGGHAANLQTLIKSRGIASEVFTEFIRADTSDQSRPLLHWLDAKNSKRVTIYHHSTSSSIPELLVDRRHQEYCIVDYHNITPPSYFDSVGDGEAATSCRQGLLQLDYLNLAAKGFWADSKFNAMDLQGHGQRGAQVLPIMRDYAILSKTKDAPNLKDKISNGVLNLLFVGRIVPNKCQHELLLLLKSIKEIAKKPVRLVLIGGINPGYFAKIKSIATQLDLSISRNHTDESSYSADILIPGQLSDEEMATFYRHADFFVSLSDHEGFCVPIVEAMFFGLPIIAHNAAVIPETLGNGGLLINKNHLTEYLQTVLELINSPAKIEDLKTRAISRSFDYSWDQLILKFDTVLKTTLDDANRYHNLQNSK